MHKEFHRYPLKKPTRTQIHGNLWLLLFVCVVGPADCYFYLKSSFILFYFCGQMKNFSWSRKNLTVRMWMENPVARRQPEACWPNRIPSRSSWLKDIKQQQGANCNNESRMKVSNVLPSFKVPDERYTFGWFGLWQMIGNDAISGSHSKTLSRWHLTKTAAQICAIFADKFVAPPTLRNFAQQAAVKMLRTDIRKPPWHLEIYSNFIAGGNIFSTSLNPWQEQGSRPSLKVSHSGNFIEL